MLDEYEEVVDLAASHSSKTHPGLDRKPGTSNWVDQEGGLPDFIERIAKHIHSDSGLSISHAIAAAVERVKVLAAKGNAKAIAALAQWQAKRASAKARPNKGKGKSLSGVTGQEVDLAILRRTSSSVYSTKGGAASSKSSGVRGSAFNESKHQRTQTGQFGKKISPLEMAVGRRAVEGGITNLKPGETFTIPGNLGWVKRTPGGYFIQGPAGFTASVRTISEAIQAAGMIVAGKARGAQ
jgi:hypothetical protein